MYDSQNRLITATVGSTTDQFYYDSKNRVIERAVNGVSTYYIYDGWDLIEERDSSGNVLATYVRGVRQDEILTKTNGTTTVYYHYNALASVTDLTNASGVVVEKYKFDAFGKAAIMDGSGNPLTATAFGNRFLFAGREYLNEINIYDYRMRMYSSDLGRFLQTDPILFAGGDVNIYRYCGNNPLNLTDVDGLCPSLTSDLQKDLQNVDDWMKSLENPGATTPNPADPTVQNPGPTPNVTFPTTGFDGDKLSYTFSNGGQITTNADINSSNVPGTPQQDPSGNAMYTPPGSNFSFGVGGGLSTPITQQTLPESGGSNPTISLRAGYSF